MSFLPRFFLAAFALISLSFAVPEDVLASEHGAKKESGAHGGGAKKEEAKGDADKAENADGSITGGEHEGDPVYVHLKPLVFPVINDKGAQQVVNLIIDLEVKSFDVATKLNASRPKVNDAILTGLYGSLSDEEVRNSVVLDIAKVKHFILQAMEKSFGKGIVKDVLIQAASQRKL
jgi:flagellar basal body-associated protein FliL